MTLQTQTPRVVIIGNGTRGPYSFTDASSQAIRATATNHIRLTRYAASTDDNNDGTLLVEGTDYTVGGTQDARTFTLAAGQAVLTSNQRIVAERVQNYSQDLSLTTGGAFNAAAVEARIDKISEFQQELKARLDRVPALQFADATANVAFPSPPTAGSAILGRSSDGSIVYLTAADIGTDVVLGTGWGDALETVLVNNISAMLALDPADNQIIRFTASGAEAIDQEDIEVIPTGEVSANAIDDLIGGYRWNSASLSSTMVVTTKAFSSGDINATTNRLTWTAHGRWTGEGGIVSAGDGLTANTTVYYLRWYDDNTLTLHPTCEDALSGTNTVDITGTTGFTLSILRDPRQGVYKLRAGASLTGSGGALVRQINGSVSPRMFGATLAASDNSAAIMAAFNYMRYSWNASRHAFDASVDFEGIQYFCSRPVHIFNLRQPDAKFGNGGIYSTATGKIALCLAGMNAPVIENFEVYGDQTSSPAVGIYYGRSYDGATAPIAPDARMSDVRTQGFFSQAGAVNFASETESLINCSHDNQHRSLTAVSFACIRNMQSWVDQFGSALTSDFGNLPTTASGNHSNILHMWSQHRVTRNSVIAMAITGITKANPAVVTVSSAELTASGLTNGDPIFLDIAGMTELVGTVQTIANINLGAGTFQLSGINSTSYATFTAGHARNKTGSSMLIGGAFSVFGRTCYHLTYGSPSIIFDLPNGTPDGFDYEFQDENNPDQPILFRAGSGAYAIQGFRARIDSWSQTSANNIIGYEGTTGTIQIQNFYLHVVNMGTAPASDIFEQASKYTLYGATQIVPLAASLNTISAFAVYRGSTTAFDRTPKTIEYGDESALTVTAAYATPGTSSFAYTSQTFRGERIGGRYFFTMLLAFTPTNGTASGAISFTVGSLPYLPVQETPLTLGRADNVDVLGGSSDNALGAYMDTDGKIYIWRFRDATTGAQAGVGSIPTGTAITIHISGNYEVVD